VAEDECIKRLEAVRELANWADALRARGATSLFVFGFTARDEADGNSDLDVFIEYDPKKKFSLIDLARLKHFLEDELGLPVDVTTRDSLHPALREEIEEPAQRVI
jgi:predicted nucleotidyltransferase